VTELQFVIKHPIFYTGFVRPERYVFSYERDWGQREVGTESWRSWSGRKLPGRN